ncbi:hypothetical protein EJ08DRAFT_653630 [Tothia fuscella]|uniref:SH3 domain-containing protein n=1 Tax=Tothia fuscella TaxID=1048955 RepID=A0A9P4NGW6_9PEZI|nr:hypothetical protein EJ08DRAFT_653630 [Tothia fuscella]
MAYSAQPPPMRFPCWVKAVYSWGGESKKDLGFMEGDLIECLNAGDGSWWMGRLKRDRRMCGLFPSNFVEVLPEDFSPIPTGSRNPSPLPLRQDSGNRTPAAKAKSGFRKPFQAYYKAGSPNPEVERSGSKTSTAIGSVRQTKPFSSMKRPSIETRSPTSTPLSKTQSTFGTTMTPAPRGQPYTSSRASSPAPSSHYHHNHSRAPSPPPPSHHNRFRAPSPAPPSHYNHSRAPSPAPPSHYSHSRAPSPGPPSQFHHARVPSPAPPSHYSHSRAPSPAPPSQYRAYSPGPPQLPQQYRPHSRGPSPTPYDQYEDHHSRAPSPNPQWDDMGSPPPPPPPHRYAPSRAPSPQPYSPPEHHNSYHTPIAKSPRVGHTPSPFTNAMNDVMNCIEDMGIAREPSPQPEAEREPPSVWSPEAFDEIYSTARRAPARSHTAFETGQILDSGYGSAEAVDASSGNPSQLDDYVSRMESRLRHLHEQEGTEPGASIQQEPPTPPPKNAGYQGRPQSSLSIRSSKGSKRGLRQMKSTYELGKEALNRTFTLKSNATTSTNSSSSTELTNHTLMSGTSAGGFSATSAGSYYRKKFAGGPQRPMSTMDFREANNLGMSRPETPVTGLSYHSSHDSVPETPGTVQPPEWMREAAESPSVLGGLATPKAKKSGFFKKMIDSAKTGAANARSTISISSRPGSAFGSSRPGSAFGGSRAHSPTKQSMLPNGVTSIAGGTAAPPRPQSAAARDMGLGGANDWVQVRRDVNRSNSLSKNERVERADRCQLLDLPVIAPIDELLETAEGDEGLDGLPITDPTDFNACALALVDKSARFVNNLPPTTNAAGLVQGHLCRPYRSDVQRLRAIFTWTAERISWEEDFELGEHVDTRRVIHTKRGCSQEIAILVAEMCAGVGIHAEVVQGYLKTPGEALDFDMASRPNHWWNAVIADGEWRIMDCSLASPTNAKRKLYSTAGMSSADGFWFLARPMEICYTHVPLILEQQHIVPPIAPEVLLALPTACPPYFRNNLKMVDFDTSALHLENLELSHIHVSVPEDVECVAEIEVRAFAQDADGDFFESGDLIRKPVLSQAEWLGGGKRFTIKALLPGDEGEGVLKVYAGKRGLMHSIKSNPHALALALPLTHTGQNPPYTFFTRHPTPHAQRHDLYVVQPQCARLAANNTFVFSIRQHPSSLAMGTPNLSSASGGITFSSTNSSSSSASISNGRISPAPYIRPASAMSISSNSNSGSNYSAGSHPSNSSSNSSGLSSDPSKIKPAKLAIQSPSGKIIRLTRKMEHLSSGGKEVRDGTEWETVIKVGERGVWRGLVLADRSARWCVFGEWECA